MDYDTYRRLEEQITISKRFQICWNGDAFFQDAAVKAGSFVTLAAKDADFPAACPYLSSMPSRHIYAQALCAPSTAAPAEQWWASMLSFRFSSLQRPCTAKERGWDFTQVAIGALLCRWPPRASQAGVQRGCCPVYGEHIWQPNICLRHTKANPQPPHW